MTKSELRVAHKLDCLNPINYRILNDLLIPSGGNLNTTQIDHVVISKFGIFCIETKSKRGWISGKVNNKYWLQTYYYSKEEFFNPILQNFCHTDALRRILTPYFKNLRIIPLVVFSHADRVSIHGAYNVIKIDELYKKIRSFKREILTEEEMDSIEAILNRVNMDDPKQHIIHSESVERYIKSKEV